MSARVVSVLSRNTTPCGGCPFTLPSDFRPEIGAVKFFVEKGSHPLREPTQTAGIQEYLPASLAIQQAQLCSPIGPLCWNDGRISVGKLQRESTSTAGGSLREQYQSASIQRMSRSRNANPGGRSRR